MSFWQRLFNEPVLIAGAIRAILYASIQFGSNLSELQVAAVIGATEAVLLAVTRALVTPNQLAEARVAAGGSPTTPRND